MMKRKQVREMKKVKRVKIRPESFGGIIFDPNLKLTAYVDREFMKKLGYSEFPEIDHLSAPEVVHVEVTKKCPLNCKHCYSAGDGKELTAKQMKGLIDILAEMNVFQIAFGGGEPFSRKDFIEIAKYAYDCGIIPNVTTNGVLIKNIDELDIFGQINVSLDGADEETYFKVRGCKAFRQALEAVKTLAGSFDVGINVVVTRHNFEKLPDIFELAEELGICEVMLIRVKPVGRCEVNYEDLKLSRSQLGRFDSTIRALLDYDVALRVDCAFMPFLNVDENVIIGMQGCDCGISSLAVKADGRVVPCSFLNYNLGYYTDIKEIWNRMDAFRNYTVDECNSCDKVEICRGGCRVFGEKFGSGMFGADVECLRILSAVGYEQYGGHN
jgi:radical SAM protein with 4Fe4S-binding SPASM domain